MKRISIKSMSLRNFKGIAQLDVDFGTDTSISGRNGTGKTTVLDAFTWTLFDKDGRDSAKFEVATTDKDGNFIPRLSHEVTLVLDIDGETMTFTKRKYDNWVKQRGTTTERFSGWKTEYLIDSVPMREKDYLEKVAKICDYDTFKLATIPGHLMTWKTDKRRELLLNMAGGNLTNEEIVGDDQELQALVKTLKNKTFEEYNIQIKAEIKRLKKERDELEPQLRLRVNDIRLDLPSLEDVQREIQEKENAIRGIDEEIRQRTSAVTMAENMQQELRARVQLMTGRLMNGAEKIRSGVQRAMAKAQEMLGDVELQIQKRESELDRLQSRSDEILEFIKKHQEIRQNLINELAAISAEKFRPFCPTCGQPLQGESKAQIKASFCELKYKRQTDVQQRGQNNNSVIEQYQAENAKILGQKKEVSEWLVELRKSRSTILQEKEKLQLLTIEQAIASDPELSRLQSEIRDLSTQTGAYKVEQVDITDLQEQQTVIRESLSTLNQTLADIRQNNKARESRDAIDQRIRQIETMIANAEQMEDKLNSFSRRRVEMLEKKINSMFSMVRFRLFKEQVNGGLEEIAEAYVEGVPYTTNLNTGRRINAGIDMCNAISKYYSIEAPVFVDNAEAANTLIPSLSQMVRLIVTEDDKLKVTINKD